MSRNPRRRQDPVRICSDCQQITTQPIVIQRIEPKDGIGWSLYACLACAPKHPSPLGARCLWLLHVPYCWECDNEGECPVSATLRRVFEPEFQGESA